MQENDRRTRIILTAEIGMVVIASALVGHTVLTHLPGNHISFEPRVLYAVSVLTVIAALGNKPPRFWRTLVIGAAIAFAVLLTIVDRCNFLVQYDRWLKRGMPVAGTCSVLQK